MQMHMLMKVRKFTFDLLGVYVVVVGWGSFNSFYFAHLLVVLFDSWFLIFPFTEWRREFFSLDFQRRKCHYTAKGIRKQVNLLVG